MTSELIAFLNFTFEQKLVHIKSVSSDTVTEVPRYAINWREYQTKLSDLGLKSSVEDRPVFKRYLVPKPEPQIFNDLAAFQNELKATLAQVVDKKILPYNFLKQIFQNTSGLSMNIEIADEDFRDDLTPENLAKLHFNYDFSSDTYRQFILAIVRDLIVKRLIFTLEIDECGGFNLPASVVEHRPTNNAFNEINDQPLLCPNEDEPSLTALDLILDAPQISEDQILNEMSTSDDSLKTFSGSPDDFSIFQEETAEVSQSNIKIDINPHDYVSSLYEEDEMAVLNISWPAETDLEKDSEESPQKEIFDTPLLDFFERQIAQDETQTDLKYVCLREKNVETETQDQQDDDHSEATSELGDKKLEFVFEPVAINVEPAAISEDQLPGDNDKKNIPVEAPDPPLLFARATQKRKKDTTLPSLEGRVATLEHRRRKKKKKTASGGV